MVHSLLLVRVFGPAAIDEAAYHCARPLLRSLEDARLPPAVPLQLLIPIERVGYSDRLPRRVPSGLLLLAGS